MQSIFLPYKAVIYILVAFYIVACFTPLRLEHDSLRYFAIKDCIEAGYDAQCPALSDFLPHGFPLLLVALSRAGLLSSFTVAFINAVFLLCSVVMTRKIMDVANPVIYYTLVLLNWTIIKLFAYPLSEMQYMFFSTASLYCFFQYTKTRKWHYLLFSLAMATAATYTRSIGFALLAALAAGFAWENRKRLSNKIVLLISALVIAAMVFAPFSFPGTSHYVDALFKPKNTEVSFSQQIGSHFSEWGQLLINSPAGKLQAYMPATVAKAIFITAGIILIAWFIYALYRCWKNLPVVVIFYLSVYTLVTFKWSHSDPRFWVPVLPLIIAVILKAPFPSKKWLKPIVFSAYVMMGIIACSFSLYTQFNKKAFARTQANGIYQKEYQIHFFGDSLGDQPPRHDVLEILEKYDRFSSHNSRSSSH